MPTAWASLDLEAAVPVFLQLYRQLASAILSGSVRSGDRLPSARRLAADLGVHYHTVNKAYTLLRRDGFVVLNRRKELSARRPETPGSAYVGDWSTRQEALLHEAMGRGVAPADLRAHIDRLLQRATRGPRRPRMVGV